MPINNGKTYNLEERTLEFAKRVRDFTKKLERTIENIEYIKQLIRASSSPGANYIEANESISIKDFYLRIKVCRKEAKEAKYWLCLVICKPEYENEREILKNEAIELTKIFSSIKNSQNTGHDSNSNN